MHRLLIVDDERHIVDWLFEMFLDSMPELDIVKAYSAQEALQRLEASRVDVVLSDVRMPGMSGLELMERIRTNWPACRIVFLTGYSEFEYIYAAKKQAGVNYLLKTEDDDVIVVAVREAINEIERERGNLQWQNRALAREELATHLMRKELLLDVAEGKVRLADVNGAWLDKLSIPFDENRPALLLLGRWHDAVDFADYSDKYQLLSGLSALSERYFSSFASHALLDVDKHDLLWILQSVIPEDDADVSGERREPRTAFSVREALERLQAASEDELKITLSFLLYEQPVPWPSVRERWSSMKAMADVRLSAPGGMPVVYAIEAGEDQLIERIKAFVRSNLHGELTLARISENVNYNSSYVSRLFKQTTGTNLFDFIHRARISKAKELLEDGSRTIQEIARATGFDSPQYFATAFKKTTGTTPNEYRSLRC